MIWERDYMKGRSSGDGAPDEVPVDSPLPPFDIFAGLERQELPPQGKSAALPGGSEVDHARPASVAPHPASRTELPLNRLLKRHPRFFWYIAIAVLALILGILLGKKL